MSSVTLQMTLAFVFGVVFIITLLTLAVRFPHPTPFQYTVFRIVLSVAAAGVAAMVPGFLDLEVKSSTLLLIRAGGALALFVIVFFFKPAPLHEAKNAPVTEVPPPPARLPNGTPFPAEMRDAFRRVWTALGDVYVAGERLWRDVSNETLGTFATKLAQAQECIAQHGLFFSDEDYAAITRALQAADFYYDGKRQLSDLYQASDVHDLQASASNTRFILEAINRQIAENRRWLSEYRDVLGRVRSSLHRALVA